MAAKETAAWQKAGLKPLNFEGQDEQKILTIAYVDAWDELDWKRISSGGPEAQQIREKFEAEYGQDLTDVVPAGATIAPQE